MKHRISFIISLAVAFTHCGIREEFAIPVTSNDFDVAIEQKWHDLESNPKKVKQFGGKWILAGNIVFRKRSSETVSLDCLHLRWNGKPLDKVTASLYRKTEGHNFCPIQKNLVCDGCWNKKKQVLKLHFKSKQVLGPTNIYSLVLTVPEEQEEMLKSGSFDIEPAHLPYPFQQRLLNQQVSFNFKDLKKDKTS